MKKLSLITTIIFALITIKASAQSNTYSNEDPGNIAIYHNYFRVIKEEYLDVCGPKNFYKLTFENNSSMTLNITIAIKNNKGKWEVGASDYVKSGGIATFGICYPNSEEKYIWWAQPSDKANKMPSRDEINRTYQ